jgi:thermitase
MRLLLMAGLVLVLAPSAQAQIRQQSPPADDPREVIVRFRAGADGTERAAVRQATSTQVARTTRLPGVQVLKVDAATTPEEAIRALERDPDVIYAERNAEMRAFATTPNDPRFGELWGLRNLGQSIEGLIGTPDADIDAELAWDLTVGSESVIVGVVDSGVAYDHPDLAQNTLTALGRDFVDDDNDPRDLNDHGTHVAGTVAAVGNNSLGVAGVTWNSKILPVRALDGAGLGFTNDLADALDYAADNGARVVNGSFGGGGGSLTFQTFIAQHPETLFVFAAGNDGTNNDAAGTQVFPCNVPLSNVICVAATDQNDQLAGFSNFGATSVDLGAPGTNILSTRPHFDALLSTGFDGPSAPGWTVSPWVFSTTAATGTHSIADSTGNYSSNSNSVATAPSQNLAGLSGCHVDFALRLQSESGFDFFSVERTVGGGGLVTVSPLLSGSTLGAFFPLSFYLDADGLNNVVVRFRFSSNATNNFDGAYVDDVVIRCVGTGYAGNEFQFLDGTSMASPHVAGAAALFFARNPSATVAQARSALLTTGDARASLAGRTVTARRLNACTALGCNTSPPPSPPPQPSPPQPAPPQPSPPQPPPTQTPPAARTLADVNASGCKRTGRGRRTRVSCRLSQASLIRRVSVRLLRGRKVVARESAQLRRGVMTIRVRRTLRRGRYALRISLVGRDGSTRTFTKRLRV